VHTDLTWIHDNDDHGVFSDEMREAFLNIKPEAEAKGVAEAEAEEGEAKVAAERPKPTVNDLKNAIEQLRTEIRSL